MLSQVTDQDLVKRFTEGDEPSFNELVRRYYDKIYWHARRMAGNHLDADDIVQEVLLVMYDKLKTFRFDASLYTWIYRVTATRSINHLNRRKPGRHVALEDSGEPETGSGDDIALRLEQREALEKLDTILLALPAKQREVFILRNFDELSYEEIAAITGTSIGGLKANYYHAMAKVNEAMQQYAQ